MMLSNCGAGEDSWESLGQQEDQTSQFLKKSVLNIHWKDGCWSWSSNNLATWCKEPTHWKRPWCWEILKTKRKRRQRIRWLDSITDSMDMNLSKLWKTVEDRGTWHAAVHRVQERQARLRGWMTRQIQTDCPSPWLCLFVKPMAYAAVSSHNCQILILSNFLKNLLCEKWRIVEI